MRRKKGIRCLSGAAERGFGQSVLGVWGTVGAWERRRGTVRFASRAVVPRCRVTVLGPLGFCTPKATSKVQVVVTTREWTEPVLAWLVASKDCGRGTRGGVCVVYGFVEVAG